MVYFIGDGSQFWQGVPMRDLSTEEWEALPQVTRDALLAAKLFGKRKPDGRPERPATVDAPAPVQGSEG